jgi:hypothetical protein
VCVSNRHERPRSACDKGTWLRPQRFLLKEYAKRWLAEGVVIRKHLEICAHQYRSGSGDKGINWVDAVIHTTWYSRDAGPPVIDMWDHPETWVAETW